MHGCATSDAEDEEGGGWGDRQTEARRVTSPKFDTLTSARAPPLCSCNARAVHTGATTREGI